MFSKVALLVTAAFAASAMASPVYGSCNSGPVQCCGSVHQAGSIEANDVLAGLVGAILGPITAQVGAQCNPITAIGVGSGANWSVFLIFPFIRIVVDGYPFPALLPLFAASRTSSVRSPLSLSIFPPQADD